MTLSIISWTLDAKNLVQSSKVANSSRHDDGPFHTSEINSGYTSESILQATSFQISDRRLVV
jgi:hypothetical protein